jgi:XTP/dITP diphosphohydrolase
MACPRCRSVADGPLIERSASIEPSPLIELVEIMSRLRRECAWKAEQTHESLARYLLEETHEVLEAIDTGDRVHLREELGDVLLQVYFHAAIAAEDELFDISDVAADLIAKLIRRNPHVFGEVSATDPAEINDNWEAIKAAEKQRDSVLDGIPLELPALLRASKVLDRLERANPVLEPSRLVELSPVVELVETTSTDIGDRLLAIVAEARAAGIDPEQALRNAVRRLTD